MAFNIKKFIEGIRIFPKTSTSIDAQGEMEVLSSDGKLRYHNGSTTSPVLTEAHTATLTNKTIDADDNTISDLQVTNLKAGVLDTDLSSVSGSDDTIPSAKAAKTYIDAGDSTNATNLSNHINDTTDAHDASAISVVPTGNLAADDVQEALEELQSDIDTADSDLSNHIADTSTHGVTGDIVGTTDTQSLTNKTIDADLNTISNIDNADIKAGAAIARNKLANGTADHVIINDGSGVLSSEANLAISRGGTGAGTATAGFDNLAPSTTKGDLIVHNGSDNIRIPVGTDGFVLTADNAEVSGVKWAAAGGGGDVQSEWVENGFNNYVKSQYLTAVNGAPSAGQFRTFGIINREKILDPENSLKSSIGLERIISQQIIKSNTEYGPNGEIVYKPINDKTNHIRYVGNWYDGVGAAGSKPNTDTANDYIEIIFWGTGLNLLLQSSASRDARATVDGGAEGANFMLASTVLNARGYATNLVFNVANGLTEGLHSVKIRHVSGGLYVYGFEILNEVTTVKVNKGIAYSNGTELSVSSQQSLSYNSSFEEITLEGASNGSIGTRGANVVIAEKSDGSVVKYAYRTNSSQANLTSADHTYEDMVEVYNWRTFGANRADDFSTLESSTADRYFALDDALTNLNANDVNNPSSTVYIKTTNATNAFIEFTFYGTGLDIVEQTDAASVNQHTFYLDGSSLGTTTTSFTTPTIRKIVSGAQLGTHVFRMNRDATGTNGIGILEFRVYCPKKPTLPTSSIEIGQYYLNADFSANTTAARDRISTGVVRKASQREFVHVGSWSATQDSVFYVTGLQISSSTLSDYVEFSFFGTGFCYRGFNSVGSGITTANVTANGSTLNTTNFSGITKTTSGGGPDFNTSTGVLTLKPTAGTITGMEVTVNGLPLDFYKIRITNAESGKVIGMEAIDIITPIYANKINEEFVYALSQESGNIGPSDLRKLSPVKSEDKPLNYSRAVGITSGPTTTSTTLVPCPDMYTLIKCNTGKLDISFDIQSENSGANFNRFQLFLNGYALGYEMLTENTANSLLETSYRIIVAAPIGINFVQVLWRCDAGTATANGIRRSLMVKEYK